MEKDNTFKDLLQKYKVFIVVSVCTLIILSLSIFILGNKTNNKNITNGNKGMIVLKEEMVANKIKNKDSFIFLTCNSSSAMCSDLYTKIEKSDIVDDYQIIFLDLYGYVKNIVSTKDDVQRKEYVNEFNQLKAKYNIKKLPTIQIYKEGILDKNKSDIYSNEYLKNSQEKQASELQDIISDIKEWIKK